MKATKYVILAWLVFVLLLVGTFQWSVYLDPPETDSDVVSAGFRARALILERYTVYLDGKALTMEEAMVMVNY